MSSQTGTGKPQGAAFPSYDRRCWDGWVQAQTQNDERFTCYLGLTCVCSNIWFIVFLGLAVCRKSVEPMEPAMVVTWTTPPKSMCFRNLSLSVLVEPLDIYIVQINEFWEKNHFWNHFWIFQNIQNSLDQGCLWALPMGTARRVGVPAMLRLLKILHRLLSPITLTTSWDLKILQIFALIWSTDFPTVVTQPKKSSLIYQGPACGDTWWEYRCWPRGFPDICCFLAEKLTRRFIPQSSNVSQSRKRSLWKCKCVKIINGIMCIFSLRKQCPSYTGCKPMRIWQRSLMALSQGPSTWRPCFQPGPGSGFYSGLGINWYGYIYIYVYIFIYV